MKTISALTILSLLILSCSSENNDPAPPTPPEVTLTGFSPTSGTGGTVVTLTGTNFSPTPAGNLVKFNGIVAVVNSATSTNLTVTAPAGGTTGKITVEVDHHVVTSTDNFTFNAPVSNLTITGFSPATGTTGTTVTITGTNFSPVTADNTVKFNGTAAGVTAASATSLTVIVPAGITSGKITVQVGTALATSATDFIYVQPAAIAVTTFAGNGTLGSADGSGTAARFYQPTGLDFDAAGNMYVADNANHLIRKITPDGVVSTLAGSGTAGFLDGTGTAAQFEGPFDVAVDAAGNIYVSDAFNHSIRKITSAGVVTTLAGNGNYGFADGGGAGAMFYIPQGIDIDSDGNLYVADKNNQRIRKITPTGTVTTVAGLGGAGGSDDGDATVAQFSSPLGVAVDASGNLYIADGNHRIRKITSGGITSTLAGSTAGITDADGSAARFNKPGNVAVDANGNVYVADDDNERIRKVTPSGTVTTIAGGFVPGYTDGVGEDAQFRSPTGIAIDAAGDIYVADRQNHSIRKIH